MRRTLVLLFIIAVALACSWDSPNLPDSDAVLTGAYVFSSSDNSITTTLLEGATLEFTLEGRIVLTNPDCSTEEFGVVDIVEQGSYSFSELAQDEGFLMLDITRQTPARLAPWYVFHGGLNRLRYGMSSADSEERLSIRLVPDGSTRTWATFTLRIPPVVSGDYTFVRSTEHELEALLQGSTVRFAADSTFAFTNPVSMDISHTDTTILVLERGTYSIGMDKVEFVVLTQEPAGADTLFLLEPPSVTARIGIVDGLLALVFTSGIRADSTLWSPPQEISEEEPNDTPGTATDLGTTGSYQVAGSLSSGGVSPDGWYAGDLDHFRFTAGFDGELSLDLSWQDPADLDLYVVDADGEVLSRSANPGQTPPEFLTFPVEAGQTGFVLVASIDNPGTYGCTVNVP